MAIDADALSRPESTNDAPEEAAPSNARRNSADSTIRARLRDRTDLTTRLMDPRTSSRPSPAWMPSATGPFASALPIAVRKPPP